MDLEWKKVKEEKYNAGWRKMIRKTFQLPNGDVSDYDIKDEETAVHILAITSDKKVILEKTFRPGTETIVLDMPAGYVDEGETPKEAAKRELLEETGLTGDFELAGKSIDDAYSNTIRYTYVAKNCVKAGEQKLENDEVFEIVEMTLDEFKKHLRSCLLTHAESGYIAFDYLGEL